MLKEPKNIEIKGRQFILSKMPSMAGYEVAMQLPTSCIPKVGEFSLHMDLLRKLIAYVAVPIEGEGGQKYLRLTTDALIDNHTGNWETLMALGWEMAHYNCDFFQEGGVSTFCQDAAQKLPLWITETCVPFLESLFRKNSPPTKNSKKTIR